MHRAYTEAYFAAENMIKWRIKFKGQWKFIDISLIAPLSWRSYDIFFRLYSL